MREFVHEGFVGNADRSLESHKIDDVDRQAREKNLQCQVPVIVLWQEEHVTVPQTEHDKVDFLGAVTESQTIFLRLQAVNQHQERQEMCDVSYVLKLVEHRLFFDCR